MSNSWSGKIAKTIGAKKHSKRYWNTLFSTVTLIIIVVFSVFAFHFMCDHISYEESHIFVEYKDKRLITATAIFDIPERELQEVVIGQLTESVKSGDELFLKLSVISGELLEARKVQKIVYKKAVIDPVSAFVGWLLLGLPMLGLCVFMLIVTNIKNPGKRLLKLQKSYMIMIYK